MTACEWPIDSAGPHHGEPCGATASALVRFRVDRMRAIGKALHRRVCGRHIGVALRAGWHREGLL